MEGREAFIPEAPPENETRCFHEKEPVTEKETRPLYADRQCHRTNSEIRAHPHNTLLRAGRVIRLSAMLLNVGLQCH
jgi:hypothetical protein